MKVTYITDACVLVEYKGKKLLCDPWLSESVCYGALYHYPPLNVKIEEFRDVDYIYISHIHEDHLDVNTLKYFPKEIPILIHCYEEKHVLNKLKSIEFENVIELKHKEIFSITNEFSIEILAADNCDPAICHKFFGCQVSQLYEKSLQIDSLAIIKGGDYVVVNTNDCPYELSHTMNSYIIEKYNHVDFLLTSYNAASPYPQCFENFSEQEMLIEKEKIRKKCLNRTVNYCRDLNPKFVLPFAAQRVIGGEFYTLNKFTATTPLEELEDELKELFFGNKIQTKVTLLNSEEYLDLSSEIQSKPFEPSVKEERERYFKEVLSQKKYIFQLPENKIEKDQYENLLPKLKVAQKRMYRKMDDVYYNLRIDSTLYIDAGQDYIYKIPFNGEEPEIVDISQMEEPFLKIKIDYTLLVMILERRAHWNNAEFGSFIKYYRQPNVFNRSMHHVISYLHM
ncbi:MBL fold metallo-hydrolase [Bacillus sp. FJAT-42315]|uniref:MBL fold metallo-hydrolase n=1 Tax=Bacillus sp. FJAT-42315 TaxID=2014077 RepID=UPI000C24099F|nr:MBL fold metallo-hydrolase [Bacillus sp. FJAT-42315]